VPDMVAIKCLQIIFALEENKFNDEGNNDNIENQFNRANTFFDL